MLDMSVRKVALLVAATALIGAFILSIRARASLGSALWQADAWWDIQLLWVYCVITTAIWYLPIAGWLMLVSAWAKRAVMLWSILPPLALYLLERWFFGTHVVGTALAERALGYIPRAFHDMSDRTAWVTTVIDRDTITTPGSVWRLLDPLGFFSSPATWIGAIVGAAFVAVAIQLRLRRTEV